MKPFLIFKKHDKTVVVADTCSFKAAIFNVLWMLYHRTWHLLAVFLIYIVCTLCLMRYNFISNSAFIFAISVALAYLWAYGNFWRHNKLKRCGYIQTGMLIARNKDEAFYKAL